MAYPIVQLALESQPDQLFSVQDGSNYRLIGLGLSFSHEACAMYLALPHNHLVVHLLDRKGGANSQADDDDAT